MPDTNSDPGAAAPSCGAVAVFTRYLYVRNQCGDAESKPELMIRTEAVPDHDSVASGECGRTAATPQGASPHTPFHPAIEHVARVALANGGHYRRGDSEGCWEQLDDPDVQDGALPMNLIESGLLHAECRPEGGAAPRQCPMRRHELRVIGNRSRILHWGEGGPEQI